MLGNKARHEVSGVLTLEVIDGDGRVVERVYVGEITGRSLLPRGDRPSSDQGSRSQDD